MYIYKKEAVSFETASMSLFLFFGSLGSELANTVGSAESAELFGIDEAGENVSTSCAVSELFCPECKTCSISFSVEECAVKIIQESFVISVQSRIFRAGEEERNDLLCRELAVVDLLAPDLTFFRILSAGFAAVCPAR